MENKAPPTDPRSIMDRILRTVARETKRIEAERLRRIICEAEYEWYL